MSFFNTSMCQKIKHQKYFTAVFYKELQLAPPYSVMNLSRILQRV